MTSVLLSVIAIGVLLLSVILHEVAHGYTAFRLGDPTAYYAGRLTLNPLKPIDPFGTVILPLLLILARFPYPVGWAKPVPVNPSLLRDPRRGMMVVGAAGPLSNVSLALVAALILRTFPVSRTPLLFDLLSIACYLNILLSVFNLVPVPPLDGSRVVAGLLPPGLKMAYEKITPYGFLIVIGLFYLGLLEKVIIPLSDLIFSLLVGG
jgi:Zn-dependent protease